MNAVTDFSQWEEQTNELFHLISTYNSSLLGLNDNDFTAQLRDDNISNSLKSWSPDPTATMYRWGGGVQWPAGKSLFKVWFLLLKKQTKKKIINLIPLHYDPNTLTSPFGRWVMGVEEVFLVQSFSANHR